MARASQRAFARVPLALRAALALALAAQLVVGWQRPPPRSAASDLPSAPAPGAVRAAAFGDPLPAAKLLMLYLQSFDYRAANRVPYRALDYAAVEAWLSLIVSLDPQSQYPLMAASRLYAEVPDAAKQQRMLDFVYRHFLDDPARRWPWLAHAAVIAKHRLRDLALARRYAAAIEQHAAPSAPLWARQMEAFILEDMNELESARVMIGGLLDKGLVTDPGEVRFLERRLTELEEKTKAAN